VQRDRRNAADPLRQVIRVRVLVGRVRLPEDPLHLASGDAKAVRAQWGRPTSRYALHRRRDGHQSWRGERNAKFTLQHGYDTVPIDGRTAARIGEGALDGPRG